MEQTILGAGPVLEVGFNVGLSCLCVKVVIEEMLEVGFDFALSCLCAWIITEEMLDVGFDIG